MGWVSGSMSGAPVNVEGGEERGLEGFRLGLFVEITLGHALRDDLLGLVEILARRGVERRLRRALLVLAFRLGRRSRRRDLLPLAHDGVMRVVGSSL